jgi:hypothetical protein
MVQSEPQLIGGIQAVVPVASLVTVPRPEPFLNTVRVKTEIDQYGAPLFAKWGGVDKAKDCFPDLDWNS